MFFSTKTSFCPCDKIQPLPYNLELLHLIKFKRKLVDYFMLSTLICPCGSGKTFISCCQNAPNVRVFRAPFANEKERQDFIENVEIASKFKIEREGLSFVMWSVHIADFFMEAIEISEQNHVRI
ncbi:SEC-C metal-binding domain-containing protein [Sutcliffiella sp. NPDC057660]|uniref:SEC-C metal-binding domain-containing protein n=1 Tax=Sutcliffiella sp. NPDC057660 TaxID=3346199 RepID=UPI0036BF975A